MMSVVVVVVGVVKGIMYLYFFMCEVLFFMLLGEYY